MYSIYTKTHTTCTSHTIINSKIFGNIKHIDDDSLNHCYVSDGKHEKPIRLIHTHSTNYKYKYKYKYNIIVIAIAVAIAIAETYAVK